jgi:hypothetical protein
MPRKNGVYPTALGTPDETFGVILMCNPAIRSIHYLGVVSHK